LYNARANGMDKSNNKNICKKIFVGIHFLKVYIFKVKKKAYQGTQYLVQKI